MMENVKKIAFFFHGQLPKLISLAAFVCCIVGGYKNVCSMWSKILCYRALMGHWVIKVYWGCLLFRLRLYIKTTSTQNQLISLQWPLWTLCRWLMFSPRRLPPPERCGRRRFWVCSAQMYWAVLRISAGNERPKPQNIWDPIQLNQQVPGMQSSLKSVFGIIRRWKPDVSRVIFRCHKININLFLIVWKCHGLTELLNVKFFLLMLKVNPQCKNDPGTRHFGSNSALK